MKAKTRRLFGILLGLMLGVGLLFSGGTVAFADGVDVYTPLTVSGFNADVVADDERWAEDGNSVNGKYVDMTSVTHNSGDGYGCVFTSSSHFGEYGAFPGGQTITANEKQYTLQATNTYNALQITKDEGLTSGTLTLSTPGPYNKLAILSTGGSGEAPVNATVHYTDNSTSSACPVNAPDWYGGPTNQRVYGPLSRTRTGDPSSIDSTGAYLYETVIAVDPAKNVSSIVFSWNGNNDNNAVANIFAVSGVNTKYAVTYEGNGNTGGDVPTDSNSPYGYNAEVTVAGAGMLEKSGYSFIGWNTVESPTTETPGTAYSAGATFNITSNTTLYAQWEALPAAAPTVTGAANLELTYGYAEGSVSVTATAAGDAAYELSYQWYQNTKKSVEGGTAVESATGASYAIPAGKAAGTTEYYYCVVTATRADNGLTATATSDVATVTVKKKDEPTPKPQPQPQPGPTPDAVALSGSGHVQNVGDVVGKASGKGVKVGTEGRGLRLERFSLALPKDVEGGIEYRGHLQNSGWGGWVEGGAPCGTRGEGRRVEAVQMRLTGALGKTHSVWYRAHVQNLGTLGWSRDGQAAGTAGQGLRLELIEAQVLPKGEVPAGYAEGQASYVGAVGGSAHVQNVGWAGARSALEFGTTGRGRRLEAIRLSAPATPVPAGISYEAHVQNVGWQGARTAGQLAGTTGQSKRLEAVRISLTGEAAKEGNYSVWYRVHSQNLGWLGWAHDGAEAGTTGLGRRAEAIDVQVLPQGQVPRGYDAGKAACVNG